MNCSFIIPAYNEEKFLKKTVESLRKSISGAEIISSEEIIVVDNCSTDRTAEIARNVGVNLVKEPVRQIARARNTGARHAKGDILFFVDADTSIKVDHLTAACEGIIKGKAYGGGALIRFDDHQDKFFLGVLIPAFWNWVSKTFRMAAGSFIFCRKEDFEEIKGFPETMYAGEELEFVRKLKKLNRKSGQKFKILDCEPVITSSRKLSWYGNGQIVFCLFLLLFFPLAVRFRKLCWFWYRRPQQ